MFVDGPTYQGFHLALPPKLTLTLMKVERRELRLDQFFTVLRATVNTDVFCRWRKYRRFCLTLPPKLTLTLMKVERREFRLDQFFKVLRATVLTDTVCRLS